MSQSDTSRGSILIWTLFLGISLATVFFFFSQQLGAGAASQRETIEYQNARLFFESYIAYIQSLDSTALEGMRGDINFQGISGTLTNEMEQIAGVLDAGDSVSFSASPPDTGDRIKIEWDICPKDDTEMLEIIPAPSTSGKNGCASSLGYEKATEISPSPFTLRAPAGPVHYKLSVIGGSILYDNEWKLSLEYRFGFRKKLNTSLSFRPG